MCSLKNVISVHLLEDILLLTGTVLSITNVSTLTCTVVTSLRVGTSSITITTVRVGFAFINI